MQFGKYNVDIVNTGIFGLDGGSMFGVVPKPLWSRAYNQGDEKNRIPLAAKPLLLRDGKRNILIDTGNGTKYNEKFIGIYKVDVEASNMDNALKPFEISREEITDVILTHLHFDHAGGSTIELNGELQPTFPNAKYYVQKEQFEWAKNPTMKDRASFIPKDYEPLFANGMLELLDGSGKLLDDFEVIPIYGHTKAMQMVKLIQGRDSILYLADLCPTTAHLNYPFVMGYDNFPLTSLAEKQKYFPQAYEEQSILIFEHDAFIQAGRLISTEKGYKLGEEIVITGK